jgi:hypothetical protein
MKSPLGGVPAGADVAPGTGGTVGCGVAGAGVAPGVAGVAQATMSDNNSKDINTRIPMVFLLLLFLRSAPKVTSGPAVETAPAGPSANRPSFDKLFGKAPKRGRTGPAWTGSE